MNSKRKSRYIKHTSQRFKKIPQQQAEVSDNPRGPGRRPRNNRPADGVMFITATPQGTLKKMLQDMEESLDLKMKRKYVEIRGTTVRNILIKTDPWKTHCGRDCVLCDTEPGRCTQRNIIYKYDCIICKDEEATETTYIGESSRTGFERNKEHEGLVKARSLESPLFEHQQESHPDRDVSMSMKIVKKLFRPLDRKVC